MGSFLPEEFFSRAGDLSRQHLFEVNVNFPAPIAGLVNPKLPPVLVTTVSTPDKSINAIDANVAGLQNKLGGNQSFGDWTIQFRIDDLRKSIWVAFNAWMDLIHDPQTGTAGLPSVYRVDQLLVPFNTQGIAPFAIKLVNAFPTNVGALSFDTTTNEIQTFDVTFALNSWYIEPLGAGQ